MSTITTMSTKTDETMTSTSVIVFLQWSKQKFEFEISIPTSPTGNSADGTTNETNTTKFTGRSLMNIVFSLTKVPVDRQKIMVAKPRAGSAARNYSKGWWKGVLKEDYDLGLAISRLTDDTTRNNSNSGAGPQQPIELSVTLLGTAEVLAPNQKKTVFVEDLTPSERKAAEEREMIISMANVAAMIPALQIPPMYRQPPKNRVPVDGSYEEDRAYDRLVHGFSQLRIDALLKHQQNPQNNSLDEQAFPSPPRLLGKVVMTLGLELQRAYVNDLAVLAEDGTLVSGLDDGHIHMWKHCQKVKDFVHQSAGGIGIFDAFPGVDSVLALDRPNGHSIASFATAGRGCIRVWDSEGEPLLGRSSPLPYASPTGLIRIPLAAAPAASPEKKKRLQTIENSSSSSSSSSHEDPTILCLAARFRVAPPPSRRPRLAPQDNAGRRMIREIEASEALVEEDLTKLSKKVQILFVETAGDAPKPTNNNGNKNETFGNNNSSNNSSNNTGKAYPVLKTLVIDSPNPVTAMTSWRDGSSTFLVVGDNLGGIMFWKIALATPASNELVASSMRGSRSASMLHAARSRRAHRAHHTSNNPNHNGNNGNDPNSTGPRLTCTKLRYLKIASLDDPTESCSAIACLKYLDETKQLFVSTKEIPATPIASPSRDDSSSLDVPSTLFPLKPAQAVHSINVDAILNKSHYDPLDFTLAGHKDVVQSILPLPNGDLLTAGGKLDATTKVWSELQLRRATGRSLDGAGSTDTVASFLEVSPPPILREPATSNLSGYVFETALLQDFKRNDGRGVMRNGRSHAGNPFAVAVAAYNVVKIVI